MQSIASAVTGTYNTLREQLNANADRDAREIARDRLAETPPNPINVSGNNSDMFGRVTNGRYVEFTPPRRPSPSSNW
jgi:hypothetical protein